MSDLVQFDIPRVTYKGASLIKGNLVLFKLTIVFSLGSCSLTWVNNQNDTTYLEKHSFMENNMKQSIIKDMKQKIVENDNGKENTAKSVQSSHTPGGSH